MAAETETYLTDLNESMAEQGEKAKIYFEQKKNLGRCGEPWSLALWVYIAHKERKSFIETLYFFYSREKTV